MRAGTEPRLGPDELLRDVAERVLGPAGPDPAGGGGRAPSRVGLEVEWIPLDAATGRPVPPSAPEGLATEPFLHRWAEANGWREGRSAAGTLLFHLPAGGAVTYEPGGQIEYSSPAFETADALMRRVHEATGDMVRAALDEGIRLVARGMDPVNPVESARLYTDVFRYRRMADHFDRFGPAGRRMMRQTAAVHVNVDLGTAPLLRWEAANRMAAPLTAAFANSPRCEGKETGHRSTRAAQWRVLDPTRTGFPPRGDDPPRAYLEFALGALDFLGAPGAEASRPFREAAVRGVSPDRWRRHLTTLFPEVRPRAYLELRSLDSQPGPWLAVPVVAAMGILYEPLALREALEALPEPTEALLERAGERGVRDAGVREAALTMLDLALEGARRLGEGVVGGALLERTAEFRERFTARGRDPGDEGWGGGEPGDAPPIPPPLRLRDAREAAR